jgi:DNA-binding winged helix-turn-helix (wHTH) protein
MKPVWINGNKIDWQRSELTTPVSTTSIEPKILAVLQVLVEANGDVVSQQFILDTVWGNVVVAPNALQRCIAQLRKLFSDDAKIQKVIKTHPKKGYSLVASISLSAPILNNLIDEQNNSSQSDIKHSSKQSKIYMFLVTVIIFFIGLYLVTSFNGFEKQYKTIESLTSSDSIESMPSLSHDKKLLAYINTHADDEFSDKSQLILKDLDTQKTSVLLTDIRFKGGLSFSPDNQSISYSQVLFLNNTKCAQIMQLTIVTKEVKQLIPCKNSFYHDAQWLDSNTLITLKTNKIGDNEFVLFDVLSNKQTKLISDFKKPISFAYNPLSQQVAVISQSIDDNYLLSFSALNLINSKLIITNRYSLPIGNVNQAQPKWFDDNKLIIAADKKIYWFDNSGLINTTAILTPNTVFSAQPFNSHGDILTVLGQQDMDVRLRTWEQVNSDSFSDEVIERSTKKEYSGKFQPNTSNIGLISNRTGHSQIWLNTDQGLKQLTHIKNEQINTFIWSIDGNKLAFLTDNALWLKTLNNVEQPLKINFKVKDIYQWWQDGNSDYLLVNALIFDKVSNKTQPKIISLNLKTLDFTVEFKGENYWAQKISSNTLIMNDHQGHIFKLENNQRQIIKDLDPITVQWRYYWRNNMLYIQDKQQNIWQYNAIKDQAYVIQKFDLKSLFMTDFNPIKMQMLSDNYAAQQKDLVLFKASN